MEQAGIALAGVLLLCRPGATPADEHKESKMDNGHDIIQPQRRRVFVVDDEPLIADTLAEILTNAGFDAVRFYDSRLALSEAERRCPDILLTDVVMPYLDGIELATSVVKRCPTARVLLLSGYTAGADLVEPAWHKGKRFELLSKPLDPRVLLRKLAA